MSTWIIPCDPKCYDVMGAFANLPCVDWKQSSKEVKVGEYAYIYLKNPIKEIRYKCIVTKVNLKERDINDSPYVLNGENYENFGRYMELKVLKEYKNCELRLEIMRQHGVRCNMQRQFRANEELKEFISNIDI